MAVRKRKVVTSDQVDAEFGGRLPSQKQPRGRVSKAVINKPWKPSPPPPATKVACFVVSVGPDDDRNMQQFLADIELALSAIRDGALLSVSQASYVATPPGTTENGYPNSSNHYRWEDWEQWQGFPDLYPPDRWEAVHLEKRGETKAVRSRTPREALDDLREYMGDRYPEPRVSHYDVAPVGDEDPGVPAAPRRKHSQGPAAVVAGALGAVDLFEGF